jgi:hypothetical protein
MIDKPLWRKMYETWDSCNELDVEAPFYYAAELRVIADEVEHRGDKDLDRDPGETADWLRAEADRAEAEFTSETH